MKTATRINTHSRRFDLRLAAKAMDRNIFVASQVLSDEAASDAHRYQAMRLIEVTELNLLHSIGCYLDAVKRDV
jgi:hypothetical protein